MKKPMIIGLALLSTAFTGTLLLSFRSTSSPPGTAHCPVPPAPEEVKGCVFKTVYEGEGLDSNFILRTPDMVLRSEQRGLQWLVKAQAQDGGYGAGTHARQDIVDPRAVSTDPATTAMVAMAIMRMGSTLDQGAHTQQLNAATEYLLQHVEKAPKDAINITPLQGTQIQSEAWREHRCGVDCTVSDRIFTPSCPKGTQ